VSPASVCAVWNALSVHLGGVLSPPAPISQGTKGEVAERPRISTARPVANTTAAARPSSAVINAQRDVQRLLFAAVGRRGLAAACDWSPARLLSFAPEPVGSNGKVAKSRLR
jgi:hypothetical protein